MSRQERAARKARLAAVKAAQVVKDTTKRISKYEIADPTALQGHVDNIVGKPSPSQATPEECKRLRDGGMAWWEVGQKLGLAGPAASSAEPEGKRGAAAARKLYAQANGGAIPRTLAPRKGAVAKPQGPGRDGTKTDRKITLVEQGYVIPPDMSDEEVELMLHGRTIEWAIDIKRLCGGKGEPEWVNMEARVHPDWCRIDDEPDKEGNRTVRFREYLGRDQHGNLMSGPTRTVRVSAIHTIR